MTLNELAYQTIEAIRPEFYDDDAVDLRLVKELIHNQRSIWIRQELNKNRSIPEELVQDLGCVELEKASTAECCDFSSDCKILRTKLTIPKPINLHHRDAIERVGPIDITQKPFSLKSYKNAIFFGNGRFNQKLTAAFYYNDRIYIMSKNALIDGMTHVNIRLIASDPTEAAKFNHCSGDPCYSDDMEYPLTDWMWGYMKEFVVKQLLMKYQIPNDTTNDATHTVGGAAPALQNNG